MRPVRPQGFTAGLSQSHSLGCPGGNQQSFRSFRSALESSFFPQCQQVQRRDGWVLSSGFPCGVKEEIGHFATLLALILSIDPVCPLRTALLVALVDSRRNRCAPPIHRYTSELFASYGGTSTVPCTTARSRPSIALISTVIVITASVVVMGPDGRVGASRAVARIVVVFLTPIIIIVYFHSFHFIPAYLRNRKVVLTSFREKAFS